MFSMCPPSDRLSHACFSDIPRPVISRTRQAKPGALSHVSRSGRRIQKPRRTLRNVSRAASVGIEPRPIWEDAAAPEMAIAVARSGASSFVLHFSVGKYPVAGEPHQRFENRKKSLLRSRRAACVLDGRFSVVLMR